MEPISNADRIAAILRQRLRERGKSSSAGNDDASSKPSVTGLATLATLSDASPTQLRRACIQGLLAEQMGNGLLNDPQFQQIVSRVVDIIGEDPVASGLLDRVVADLKAA